MFCVCICVMRVLLVLKFVWVVRCMVLCWFIGGVVVVVGGVVLVLLGVLVGLEGLEGFVELLLLLYFSKVVVYLVSRVREVVW